MNAALGRNAFDQSPWWSRFKLPPRSRASASSPFKRSRSEALSHRVGQYLSWSQQKAWSKAQTQYRTWTASGSCWRKK